MGTCHKVKEYLLPERICSVPLKAQTECTPRFEPVLMNIRSIIKHGEDGYIPQLFESTDKVSVIPTAWLDTPDDALNVVQILSNRRQLIDEPTSSESMMIPGRVLQENSGNGTAKWYMSEGSLQEDCNDYIDNIGGIIGDESSGDLVLTLDQVIEGIVVIVFSDVNKTLTIPDDEGYLIDVSIDGKVNTISKKAYEAAKKFFGIFTISDGMDKIGPMNTTVRIQIRNCASNPCRIMLTHIYWS